MLVIIARKEVACQHRRQPRPPASGCHFLHRTASRALCTTSGRLSTCSKGYMFASRRHFPVRIFHFSCAMSSAETGRFSDWEREDLAANLTLGQSIMIPKAGKCVQQSGHPKQLCRLEFSDPVRTSFQLHLKRSGGSSILSSASSGPSGSRRAWKQTWGTFFYDMLGGYRK